MFKLISLLTKVTSFSIFLIPFIHGSSTTITRIGNFDYVTGDNGYSANGQQIGNFYYYNDNQGNSYTTQSIGSFDYTYGSDGYSGVGQQIGNFYYYND